MLKWIKNPYQPCPIYIPFYNELYLAEYKGKKIFKSEEQKNVTDERFINLVKKYNEYDIYCTEYMSLILQDEFPGEKILIYDVAEKNR